LGWQLYAQRGQLGIGNQNPSNADAV